MDNDEVIEIAEACGIHPISGYECTYEVIFYELERFAAEIERRTIERCAKRAEAYSYMSENFNALAEELRAPGDK